MNQLDALKQFTTVVADSGDFKQLDAFVSGRHWRCHTAQAQREQLEGVGATGFKRRVARGDFVKLQLGEAVVGQLAACRTYGTSAANRPQRSIFHRLLTHSGAMGLQIR